MTTVATRIFRIRGHVQGVGFRYATQQEAQRLGLNGWVRNCPDYTVEARATGNNDLLDALEQWLHHGPPGAKVEQVESSILDNNDAPERELRFAGFEILR
jgi:acylphosphatase